MTPPESPGGAGPRFISLVQPPLVQLNNPYPAIYYLRSFLEARGCRTRTADHSIALFERIFCRAGLERIWGELRAAREDLDKAPAPPHVRYNIRRFLSEEDRWLSVIDRLTAFLRGADREWGHLLALANGVLPGGPRFDAALAAREGQVSAGDAPGLATRLLEDLADLITHTLDPSFALIRYNPSLSGGALGYRDFSAIENSLDGYILRSFYRPLLEEEWDRLEAELPPGGPFVLGISIPFPGCLAGALLCARSARERFGPGFITVAGGGYVNTELRFLEDGGIFDYFHYLSFDRGYGSLEAILEHIGEGKEPPADRVLYKTMYRSREGSEILKPPDLNPPDLNTQERPGEDGFDRFRETDRRAAKTVFPDYRGVDFSRYLYPVDDENPMHRLWSDGHWLKAYLAHGCYWRGCAFCDVTLDYIRCFEPVDPGALFRHLLDQSAASGVRAVHLVDEAAPPASLVRLAELNREAGLPLVFWGNIRFEGRFDPDTAAVLAAGALVGVSAGIEVASPEGFKRIHKGIGLEDVVRACAAFKEQGILTHAYLIYGYWDEEVQEILDSAEILRQLFAAELLDSAFWHQFVLTRHSRIYAEWKQGLHPGLIVQEGDLEAGPGSGAGLFARNDLRFAGEEQFAPFAEPLDRLLASWMAGAASSQTAADLAAAFPFPVPRPSPSPRLVEDLLGAYIRDRDKARGELPGPSPRRAIFLGSRPIPKTTRRGTGLFWRWRLEDQRLRTDDPETAGKIAALLETASHAPAMDAAGFYRELAWLAGPAGAEKAWRELRGRGLAIY